MLRSIFALCALTTLLACHGKSNGPPPLTDSVHYQLCENDSLCPAATHCQAGVCDADCSADSDCTAGSCDARGYCTTGGPATPAPFAGTLSVGAAHLDFPQGQSTATLRVQNSGQATLEHFHIVSDNPAVTAEPSHGSLPAGEGADVAITPQPGWMGTATLRTLSSGGVATTTLTSGGGLVGYLQGTVNVTAPFALGQADLALDVHADQTGVVDDVNSLLWPARAPVTVTDDGGFATIQFTIVSAPQPGSDQSFDGMLQRQVTLSGTHSGASPLTGDYQEVISGFGAAQVMVSGTFSLSPSGTLHGLLAEAMPSFTPPTAPPAYAASSCLSGDPSCPAGLEARGQHYFALAFPFEQWSWESSITNGQCLMTQGGTPGPCVSSEDELPAIQAFAQSGSPAQIWEVYRAIASEAQLQGKSVIANTLQPAEAAYQGAALDDAQLGQAVKLLEAGLHQRTGAEGLLTSANLWRAQTVTPTGSTLDKAAGDAQRFGGTVSAALFAASQEIDRQRRTSVVTQTSLTTAQTVATQAFLDAAALATVNLDGTVQASAGAGSLVDCAPNFAAVATAFDQVRQGLNPVGYPADYIPFDYDTASPSQDIFQQLYTHVTSNDLQPALSAEMTLESDDRQFEQSQSALTSALAGVQTQLSTQVTALCGSASQGCSGGQIATDFANLQAAVLALQEEATRSANAAQKLTQLQTQLQQETGDQTVEIEAVTSDGQSEAAVAIADAREQKQNLDWQCGTSVANAGNSIFAGIGSVIGGALSGGIGGLFSGIGTAASELGNTATSAVSACEQANNFAAHVSDAGQAALAESDAQIQIQQLQNLVTDNQLIDAISDAQADSEASLTETQRQDALLTAATSQWQTDLANLQQDLTNAQTLQNVQVQNADPTFRLYQDQAGLTWAAEMQSLRAEVFLATRAFDYMTNQTYANEGEVFADATAAQLQAYVTALDDAYSNYQTSTGWGQDEYDILSLRSDILGITGDVRDTITNQILTPEQQFQAILNLPKNRDVNGNLALAFNTDTASGGVAIFSPNICQDRIADLKINVVSASLSGSSGYVGLSQGGDTRLINCSDPGTATAYALPTKNAQISAGLNLPRSAATDPTVPANTDLFDRPVLASSWVLSIDLADPRNAWIDLSQIDDLELWVHHTAVTIQTQ